MPVTFTVADHPAEPVQVYLQPVKDADDLLASTWGRKNRDTKSKEILQSSFSDIDSSFIGVSAEDNGFVRAVIKAYSHHHHLVLRPDDVWIAILGQFNFYVNAHAEELRASFVEHKGKKKLVVTTAGNRYSVDFGHLAKQMTDLIDENVLDKELKDWVLPNFTTTRDNDTVVSSVLMMSTLKAYFSYGFQTCCGIPRVTLEGERSDWVNILNRIQKLESFGDENTAWAGLLRPILSRFVSSFDGPPDLDFWSKICHYESQMSGADHLCGWITAFGVWSSEGEWQGPIVEAPRRSSWLKALFKSKPKQPYLPKGMYYLQLDEAKYGWMREGMIPAGYCEVDVELNDNGEKLDCTMAAGHMGWQTTGEEGDSVAPLPVWFMFTKEDVPRAYDE